MKHRKWTRIFALVMSLALVFSAVSASRTALETQIEFDVPEIEAADSANYIAEGEILKDPAFKETVKKVNEVLQNTTENIIGEKQLAAEVADVEMTVEENAVVGGVEYDLKSLSGIIKALIRAKNNNERKYIGLSILENIFTGLLGAISDMIDPPADVLDKDEFESTDFYAGTQTFLDTPAKDAKWSLGYAQASLVPDDINSRNYYLGGYLMQQLGGNKVEDVIDDMKVRVIAMNDNSGRGTVIFATIDCIGISNKDIRTIRNKLADYAKEHNVVSINVFSTHSHSSIDTQGLWNPLLPTMLNNGYVKRTGKGEMQTGTDEKFMKLLTTRTANAMKAACEDLETGILKYSEYDATHYYADDRPSADNVKSVVGRLGRFVFTPDSGTTPTIIVNGGAHPSITGLKTDESSGRELSADYVATMEEVINAAGYDFMFFNGAISGIYPERGLSGDGVEITHRYEIAQRYGYELGLHVLYMTKSEAEIARDAFATEALNKYLPADYSETGKGSLWYKGKTACEETEVTPILNIKAKEILIRVTNPLFTAVGKIGLTNSNMVTDVNGTYYYVSEIAYLEIGEKKVAMLPGEVSPDLFTGKGGYTAEGSVTQNQYAYPTFPEIAGDENLLVFGLANDAIGYIVPDNDYCNCIINYQELISLGETVASTLSVEFTELIDSVK